MTTKLAATIVLALAAINFVGWLAGIEPGHEPIAQLPAIVEGH